MEWGSSPHTRGLPDPQALAGGLSADHPRTRGVYMTLTAITWSGLGSSPHTRGLLVDREAHWPAERIIPAHAGFTRRQHVRHGGRRDHPRTRGVYQRQLTARLTRRGSSPHTRGLPDSDRQRPHGYRIIPACAGFTLGDPWNPNGPGVYHPPVSFTADLVPARRSCGSAAVGPRWTTTPWAA